MEIHRYDGLIRVSESDEGFELVRDGLLVVEEGVISYSGSAGDAPEALSSQIENVRVSAGLAIPTTANMHQHAFQPRWERDELIYLKDGKIKGSLMPTLETETVVRNNPELARDMAHEECDSMIENGIAEAVIYTTSSMEALKIYLEVMKARGFEGRVKIGFVFMNQNIDAFSGIDIPNVKLEVSESDEARIFDELREFIVEYPNMITMIDRFPIGVDSRLRKEIVSFCKETGCDFDTHVDESENEAGFTSFLYDERRIIQVLSDDGAFNIGSGTVRLAHGVRTNSADFDLLTAASSQLEVVACPSSNANIQSHWNKAEGGPSYVTFPFAEWAQVADVRLGIDSGAGVTQSIFAEAAQLVTRDPNGTVSWAMALEAARSRRSSLVKGATADWLQVYPDQVALLNSLIARNPDSALEEVLKATIIGATGNGGIESMYLAGKKIKASTRSVRPRLQF